MAHINIAINREILHVLFSSGEKDEAFIKLIK